MPSTTGRLALKARWVFPVVQQPLADGMLTMEGPRIVAVGANTSGAPARDLGDVAVLPGFVNPHTHLEFSDLRRPLGEPGMTFPDWIARVVAWRRGAARTTDPREPQAAAVAAGLRESLACGVTMLGDIATADAAAATTREHRVAIVSFRELMGLNADRIAQQVEIARGHLSCLRGGGHRRGGLSPHAPYTTHPEVVARACRLSRQFGVPVAMHLAESAEEMELLATGGGPLRELLSQLGSWVPTAVRAGTSSRGYLELLSSCHRSLVVHGNYLGPGDWEFLASRAATMAVVYCPRTHAYFRHARYPLADMLRAGVRVVIGTDGRGSNPDLNLLEELRFATAAHPDVHPETVLHMGTDWAATALGFEDSAGTLVPGGRADLAIVQLKTPVARDPWEALFASRDRVSHVISGGQFVASLDVPPEPS